MEFVFWALLSLIVLAVLLATWRFFTLRSRGQTILLRRLPASGIHGWRHGTIRYHGDDLEYFKLRSISPVADQVFHRQQMTVDGTRPLTPEEQRFMDGDLSVATLSDRGTHFEVALHAHALMALTAWVESAPDIRHERVDHAALRNRITRGKNGK
ncbi:DUF2550 domain-containing protein [Corynebacterium sp.]|uniref:DUF2550 domain-containing protein n=1 Tax=Corynebacterium sp. TaxID=1720 RepID=UPI0026E1005B|nr:DUF2550 domain-containing protein [Corynebacterium sp.]MDO5513140.1 DUF2550 domain-containing protein [Corynebacterium sp.]